MWSHEELPKRSQGTITAYSLAWTVVAILGCFSSPSMAQALRPMTPSDVLLREELSGMLSPDGKAIGYLKRPPIAGSASTPPLPMITRPDLWVFAIGGDEPRNLTREIERRFRIVAWAWSPDGGRIAIGAMVGQSMTIWVWDQGNAAIRSINRSPLQAPPRPTLVWISANEVLVSTLPDDALTATQSTIPQAEAVMARHWVKANEGLVPSQSVVESGLKPAQAPDPREQSRWTILNLDSGATESVPAGIPHPFGRPLASPDGRAVAYPTRGLPPSFESALLVGDMVPYEVGLSVVSASGKVPVVHRVEGISAVNPSSLSWSSDSSKLSFIGRRPGGIAPRAFVFDPRDRSLLEIELAGITDARGLVMGQTAWSTRGAPVVSVPPPFKPGSPPGPPNWWAVRADGKPLNLSAGLPTPPAQLFPEAGGAFLGVAGPSLWRIDPDGKPPTDLSERFGLKDARIVWPTDGRICRRVVVAARRHNTAGFFMIDLERDAITETARPPEGARLTDLDLATGSAVFAAYSNRGSSLLVSPSIGVEPKQVVRANTHLQEIAEPTLRRIDYQTADGRKLTGWLVLPPRFDPSMRWPLITYVYGGVTYSGDWDPPLFDDHKLLAAHGYVVLLPSIPILPPGDPYPEMSKGVLPAVDKAIEMGVADPDRLGLMGHSYGGYTVYCLVTQTNRFRTAVASAGVCDLVSLYGQFTALMRHSESPLEGSIENLTWVEKSQGRMGVPFWKDAPRYVRNSPIMHVDRVETPLLILHGDMDFVPIQQAEEFFTSLHRRGKRARFVRYWGEGHNIGSPPGNPANFVDQWERIYSWLDESLRGRPR